MKFKVLVKPNSNREFVKEEDGLIVIAVKEPPIKGKANKRVIELLAKYFGVKKSQIRIVSGLKSKEKVVEVLR